METIQKTFQEILEFSGYANKYLKDHPGDNKFRYALLRTVKFTNRVAITFNDRRDAINIKYCLAADDGKGEILRDERGDYRFTKDAMLKRNADLSSLLKEETELQVHYATELPEGLSQIDKDNFTGFVIKESDGTSA